MEFKPAMLRSKAPVASSLSNTAVVVLGMHRSGTSAMGGALNLLGVNFGARLYQAQRNVNEKGFWEHSAIVDLHDEILLNLASSWDDPRLLAEGWEEQSEVTRFRIQIARVLTKDFAESPIWGLKDPRMCRLMPLWRKLFLELEIRPLYVIMVRNPLEVAASLSKRNGFSLGKSLFLWWQHQTLAEMETRGLPRVFVAYHGLLTQPEKTLERIGAHLGLAWPNPLNKAMRAITEFLSPSLQHHRNLEFEGDSLLEIRVEAAYNAYLRAAASPASAEMGKTAEHSQAFLEHYRTLSPLLLEHMSSMAEDARRARLTLQQYYDCFAVKAAKRVCLLERYIASLFSFGKH
jgi:hypothetical protein